MSTKRKYLKAPLRQRLDDDIEAALLSHLKAHPGETQADVVRLGVRIVLGITTHREFVVQEKRISMPSLFVANLRGRGIQ